MSKKYTLDRIEEGIYVFLEYPEEENQLLIQVDQVDEIFHEGDIVSISSEEQQYRIELLIDETHITREKVNNLLEKLKNKK
ncbi:hypothetical protein CSV80_00970 [Sporosarcina sp. P12(2017)]|uniref:DUF3006 domain-containing protein n=1 Tax=unclassified Sporosarcina TaxID=2647733 RepID=UPI000C16833C|nr:MULTISPECIES: DUF3006 domain-containing protein [unclassified Sporosarcina]PIC59127.1 hypothetical protein CSV81_00970 [Sporosarcina sp. P10]PIC62448.1 hypothetical protein CSV80_00970 [Sporosarcina sp. P12(2017)]